MKPENMDPTYYGTHEDGDEPLIDAHGISMLWGKAWPKVIARAWYAKDISDNFVKEVNNYDVIEDVNKLSHEEYDRVLEMAQNNQTLVEPKKIEINWYRKLISGTVSGTREALETEGFVPSFKYNSSGFAKKTDLEWFWHNITIVIKRTEDGAGLIRDDQKTVPIIDFDENNEHCGTYTYKATEMLDVKGNSEKCVKDSNGWDSGWNLEQKKRINQILILTIPPKPKDDNCAIALSEYEAAGRIYPFTWCC